MSHKQSCKLLIKILVFLTELKFILCHLKDLGEHRANMTAILDKFEDRILYGEETTLEEYPFNVQFFNFGGLCSASILTRKTALTAAHCFDHNTNVGEMKIISNSILMYDRKSRTHEVWDYSIHEFYNKPQRFSNDIALLIIHDIFVLGATVQKVVLSKSDKWMSEDETSFVATGWGITKTRRRILMKTRLRYITPENCANMSGLPITEDMFCLYGDQKTDTCQGDSGGGVLWNKVMVGIVSHGDNCLEAPGVYANTYYFRFWIKSTVKKLYTRYCKFHNLQPKHNNK